jgi:polar amino acid transport system substrate-binding protein
MMSSSPPTAPDLSRCLNTPGTLLFGVDEAPPAPLNFGLPGSQDFRGFEVDLMHAVARRLGLVPRFRSALWSRILAELSAHQVDVVCGAATVTPERARVVAFSRPYLEITLVLVGRSGEPVEDLRQLAGRKVGVRAATEAERYLRTRVPAARAVTFELNTEQYGALASGSVAAVIDDEPIAGHFAQSLRGLTVVTPLPGSEAHYAFVVSLDRERLRTALDTVLTELEADGTLARLRRAWLTAPRPGDGA